ncbi:wall-associated receptor kinase 3-like [Prosopis cineraria]|uniref:wall-associated receptor kinase 3-like n=1 Tax=Prosopis cineraria TaxID=364024 RepID=UPI002410AB25|nr:wall-associated receptor kinase 3-like [Prosopis cineraria]
MGLSALLLLRLALVAFTLVAVVAEQESKPDCDTKCGDVTILYPFGTREGCFKDEAFHIICDKKKNQQQQNPIPYLGANNTFQVLNISGDRNELHVSVPVQSGCYNPNETNYWRKTYLTPHKFAISNKMNKFIVVGCYTVSSLFDRKENKYNGCETKCTDEWRSVTVKTSSGFCCQTPFDRALTNYSVSLFNFYDGSNVSENFVPCSYSFFAETNESFKFSYKDLQSLGKSNRSTVVLDWAVDSKKSCGGACKSKESRCEESESISGYYVCKCKPGFQGNPYLSDGCQDVDECLDKSLHDCIDQNHCHNFDGSYKCDSGKEWLIIKISIGVIIALLVAFTLLSALCWAQKQRSLKQLKERNFEQNGGNLLLQQFSQRQGYTERARIFTEEELKNATNNFDESRILGCGGQGTVYKGTLSNNTPVAIKKSRVGGDPQNIKSFINEVFVLSQINHRNVVKLLGCCLETEVPLLVYEFVDNGTLLDHLSPSTNDCSITWKTRLRIAVETAEAISYLHSAASIPIIHRDIKSANILLDHDNRAKVSDFGASRIVHLDEAQVATVIQGTIGYLDPEYLQTGQLNEKSDVYSFGIVLVELLTGKRAFKFNNAMANHFVCSMREDRLWKILDKRVLDQKENAKQLKEVALLAQRCIRVNGEERPTMKEVAMELEGLRAMEKNLQEKEKDMMVEESEHLLGHFPNDGYGSASTSISVSSYARIQKQIAFEIVDGGR